MKKRIIISTGLLCLIAVSVNSCYRFNRNDVFLRSMVSWYAEPKELVLNKVANPSAIRVEIGISGGFGFNNSGAEKTKYDQWCLKHDDMSYNREVRKHIGEPLPYEFVAADYTSVEIVSDADWDAEHPAGISLNDIVRFYSVSPIKYIRSGYVEEYDWTQETLSGFFSMRDGQGHVITEGQSPFHPVIKPVSELTPEDMVLLGSGDAYNLAFLEFYPWPTAAKEHNITVTLTTDEGEVFSSTINMTFG